MPILSIIIPVYNVEQYIRKCLDSILVQDMSAVQILLIDDGSTDQTREICDEYKEKCNNIEVYHKANGGLSSARNYGIRKAAGEYIAFLDGDDRFTSDAIVNILNSIENCREADVIIGRYINYYLPSESYEECAYHLRKNVVETSIKEDLFWELFYEKTYDWYACLNIVRREYLISNQFFFKEGVYFEDALWTPELLFEASKVDYMDAPFYVYLQNREGSITSSVSEKAYHDKQYVCRYAEDFCEKYQLSEPLKKRFLGNYNHIYVSLLADSWKQKGKKRINCWKEIEKYKEILHYSNRTYQECLYRLWKVLGIQGVSYILHLRAEWVRRKQRN